MLDSPGSLFDLLEFWAVVLPAAPVQAQLWWQLNGFDFHPPARRHALEQTFAKAAILLNTKCLQSFLRGSPTSQLTQVPAQMLSVVPPTAVFDPQPISSARSLSSSHGPPWDTPKALPALLCDSRRGRLLVQPTR